MEIWRSRRNVQRAHILSTSSVETSDDNEPLANELNDNTTEEEDFESDLDEEYLYEG